MGFRAVAPAPNTGYNRTTDWPTQGGVGMSAASPKGGGGMPLSGLFSSTITPGQSQWHPTVAWMLGFVVVELVAFHVLCRYLNL